MRMVCGNQSPAVSGIYLFQEDNTLDLSITMPGASIKKPAIGHAKFKIKKMMEGE